MRALVFLALGACGWPALEPEDRAWPIDERMGTEVFRTDHGLRVASTYQDGALQLAFEVIGDGWRLREVTPGGAITSLPDPPLPPGASIVLGRALAPTRAVISDERGDVHVLDGDAWRTLPAAGAAGELGAVLAHDGRIYAGFGGRVLVWDGAAWSEPVIASSVALGGFDAATQWMLAGDATGFDAVPVVDGVAGAAIAGPAVPAPGSAINGDASAFQVLAGDALWRFDGATFTEGDAVIADGLAAAPGSSQVVVRAGVNTAGTYTLASGAALGEVALAPFVPAIDCGCDVATDDACGCEAHTVGYVEVEIAPSLDRAGLMMADAIDGYGVLTARFLDLPFAGDPFTPPR